MALLDPAHRVASARAPARPSSDRGIHPSICLVTGFGVIVGAALLVHAAFAALL